MAMQAKRAIYLLRNSLKRAKVPIYWHKKSPKTYTVHQHAILLVFRRKINKSYAELGRSYGFVLEGLTLIAVEGDGPDTYATTLEHLFEDMNTRAREINLWLIDHPEETEERLKIYTAVRNWPAILARTDKFTVNPLTLYARATDTSEDKLLFGNQDRNIIMRLDQGTYSKLSEPSRILIEASGTYAPSLIIYPFPRRGTSPIELNAGLIHWD